MNHQRVVLNYEMKSFQRVRFGRPGEGLGARFSCPSFENLPEDQGRNNGDKTPIDKGKPYLDFLISLLTSVALTVVGFFQYIQIRKRTSHIRREAHSMGKTIQNMAASLSHIFQPTRRPCFHSEFLYLD